MVVKGDMLPGPTADICDLEAWSIVSYDRVNKMAAKSL